MLTKGTKRQGGFKVFLCGLMDKAFLDLLQAVENRECDLNFMTLYFEAVISKSCLC